MITETRFKISIPRFQRSPVDTSIYSRMMQKKEYKPDVMVTRIRMIIAQHIGSDPMLITRDHHQKPVMARQLFLHFVRKHLGYSQLTTGKLIGKNHATVFHAEQCVEKFRVIEPGYADIYNSINSKILEIINQ